MRFLLIDANSILNRAFYGIRILSTKEGVFTNGIYGFLNILFKYIDELSPTHIAAAFDLKAPTFRHKMYDGYKATRKPMPDELAPQFPLLKEILMAMNIPVIEKEGYEADDIIGTISNMCDNDLVECCVLSGDKDDLQLASENTKIYLVTTRMGQTDTKIYDAKEVFKTYGVTPTEFIDCKAIMGDKSDNIPGVSGIGEKGAFALISKYKSLDGVYENLDSGEITKSMVSKLIENKENAYLSLDLATIDKNVPLDFVTDDAKTKEWDYVKLTELFKKLEFKTFLKKIEGLSGNEISSVQKEEVTFGKITKLSSGDDFKKAVSSFGGKNIFYMLDKSAPAIAFCENNENVYYAEFSKSACEDVKSFFESTDFTKITHNLKEDIIFLDKYGIACENVNFDTEIAAYLVSPARKNYDFSELISDFCDISLEGSAEDCGQVSLADLMSAEGEDKLAKKVCALISLYEKLENEITQKDFTYLFEKIEMPLVYVLASMEICGFKVDKESLIEFGNSLTLRINSLTDEIYDLAGHEFNINSPKQLGVVLFEELGLTAQKKTKTGYSTNAEVLEKLSGKHEIIDKILEYRQLSKLNSTYALGLLSVINPKTGRIHSSLNQTVTQTGRISSAEPNLQNIPVRTPLGREMRKMFVAENDEFVLVDADYSQIELRVLAHIANDENMIASFKNGFDIHASTASKIFGVSPENVTTEMRSASKAINFGLVYGMGEFSLSRDLNISIKEAKAYIEEYLGSYPNVRKYMADTVAFAEKNGYVLTEFKRRRDIPEINARNHQLKSFGNRVAMNTPIQGTAADIIKLAMVNVYNRLKKECKKSRLILQVHDELIVEAHISEALRAQKILKEEMENAAALRVPLKVDMNTGKSWYDTK